MTTKQKSQIMDLLRNFFNDFRRKNIDIELPKKTIVLIMNDAGNNVLDYCFIREKVEERKRTKWAEYSYNWKHNNSFIESKWYDKYKNWLIEKINKKFGNEIIAYLESIPNSPEIKMGDIRDRKDFWNPCTDVAYLENLKWCYKNNNKVYSFKRLNYKFRKRGTNE